MDYDLGKRGEAKHSCWWDHDPLALVKRPKLQNNRVVETFPKKISVENDPTNSLCLCRSSSFHHVTVTHQRLYDKKKCTVEVLLQRRWHQKRPSLVKNCVYHAWYTRLRYPVSTQVAFMNTGRIHQHRSHPSAQVASTVIPTHDLWLSAVFWPNNTEFSFVKHDFILSWYAVSKGKIFIAFSWCSTRCFLLGKYQPGNLCTWSIPSIGQQRKRSHYCHSNQCRLTAAIHRRPNNQLWLQDFYSNLSLPVRKTFSYIKTTAKQTRAWKFKSLIQYYFKWPTAKIERKTFTHSHTVWLWGWGTQEFKNGCCAASRMQLVSVWVISQIR